MLDKFITKLKNSLPGAKKNEDSDEESVEETQDSEGEDSSAEDEKKKKISMMIRVVVIIALGYLAVDQFILSEPEVSVDQLTANAPKKRKKPKPVIKPAEEVKAEQPAVSTGPAEIKKEEPKAIEEAPLENINIAEKKEEEQPLVVEAPPVVETPPVEPQVPPMGENAMDSRLDQLIENVEEKKPLDMSDKIVEEATFTAPPPYDVLGRGLVYNCTDKFWACIDKPSYVTCNKNQKWNTSQGKTQECVIQNVYNSDEDCIKIQKYNVSSNQPTAFCQ